MSKLKTLNKKIVRLELSIQKKTEKLVQIMLKRDALSDTKPAPKKVRSVTPKVVAGIVAVPAPTAKQATAAAKGHRSKVIAHNPAKKNV